MPPHPGIFPYNVDDICTGCLCVGRKLCYIGDTEFYQLYSQILDEIPVRDISQVCVRICWECVALLRRFQLFKAQVKQNYTELLWNVPPARPPRLAPHSAHVISFPPPPSEPPSEPPSQPSSLIPSEDIKIEDEHWEPETFVNDLKIDHDDDDKPIKKPKKKRKTKSKSPKAKTKFKKKKKPPKIAEIDSDRSEPELFIDESAGYLEEKRIEEGIVEEKRAEEGIVEEKRTDSGLEVNENRVNHKVSENVKPTSGSAVGSESRPQCVECGKVFSSRKTYRYHLNVLHRGQNRYPCPRCGKVYQWKSNLGRHLRTHKAVDAGELHCVLCDKTFASVATYRQHLRISRKHVAETDFSFTCDECGKKFVNKTRLRDHIDWEHLNKIKFRCLICNKAYKCHTSLYVHEQNVHRNKEKKDNLCHVCGKSYQNPAKLKYHITALHTGETPHQCSHCAAAFGWYSSLYRHVREVHYKMKMQPKKNKKLKKSENEPPLPPYVQYDQ